MATSKKQVAANRRNAKKSTGPRTPEGKAVVGRNAITHGLHASDTIIDSPHLQEDRSEYEDLVAQLVDELKPVGSMQEHLVLKIANCMWRYRRAIKAETAHVNRQLTDTVRHNLHKFPRFVEQEMACDPRLDDDVAIEDSPQFADRLGEKVIPQGGFAKTLMHYEMRLDKQMARAYRMLRELKKMAAAKKSSKSKPQATEVDRFRPTMPVDQHDDTEKTENKPISPQADATVGVTPDSPSDSGHYGPPPRDPSSVPIAPSVSVRSP
jgi:hypothetical protein